MIGTFDTKGEEFSSLRERIESAGLRTLMIDVGVLGPPPFQADISQVEVAAAANENRSALESKQDGAFTKPFAILPIRDSRCKQRGTHILRSLSVWCAAHSLI